MIQEIATIKKWLSKKFDIPLEGEGLFLRLVRPAPDGTYIIPIKKKKFEVKISNDRIHIGNEN